MNNNKIIKRNKNKSNLNFSKSEYKNFFSKKIFTNYFLSKNSNKENNFNFFLPTSNFDFFNKKDNIKNLHQPYLIKDFKKINKNSDQDSLQLTQNETLLNTNDFITQRSIEEIIQLNNDIKEKPNKNNNLNSFKSRIKIKNNNSNKNLHIKNNNNIFIKNQFKSNNQLLNIKNKLHYCEFHRRIKSLTNKNDIKVTL